MITRLFLVVIFIATVECLFAQDATNAPVQTIPEKFLDATLSRSSKIEEKITTESKKVLISMQREEEKLRRRLYKIDSVAANNLFSRGAAKYEGLKQKLSQKAGNISQNRIGNYIPFLDTLKTSLNFLQSNPSKFLPGSKELQDKLKETIGKVDLLKDKFDQAGAIQQFIRERKQYLKEQLSKFGLGKQLKKFNKQAYYYSQLIKDYKEIFSDPKKIEKHAIALLNKIPAFQKFMQKNSMLASIFGMPSGNSNPVSFVGIQTRASVQQIVRSSVITSGPNPAQFISQQLQTANDQLSAIKNKIAFVDLSGNPEQMPDFKPNQQKTKPFLKRLELGANVQFGKTNNFLPTSGDFAFSLGYKLNDNGVVGIGSSYKLGISSLSGIHFSNQGFGLRSYIDWKIKGGFYVSGGYEKNYLPQLQNINVPQRLETWQESGLIGISKKYTISKKRKLTLQLSFDFLSYKNIPRSQPFLFRTGWIF
jgi:hypothetical protein